MTYALSLMVLGALGVVSAAPPSEPGTPTSSTSTSTSQFAVGLLSCPGLDTDALVDALRLRLPRIDLRTQWSPGEGEGQGRVFISVHPTEDGAAVRTEVIVEDGRGYSRRLDVVPDDERRIASVLANLLFSIEDQEVKADVEDVAVPQTSAPEDVERAVASVQGTKPEPKPEPKTEPETEPEPKPEPETEPEPEPKPTDMIPPRWVASVPLAGGVLLPLGGPRFGNLLQGGGVMLGADAEHIGGARFGLRLRYLARDRAPFRLSRLRIAVGGGYGWRVGRVDLPVRAELSVEPWWVVHEGERLSATRIGAPRSGTMALGGAVRFEPGVSWRLDAGALRAVRLGLDVGLGGSFVVDDGARVAVVNSGLEDPTLDELFRIGGLELWLGARVGVVLGRPDRPKP